MTVRMNTQLKVAGGKRDFLREAHSGHHCLRFLK
jgi:hypothetical protein